jgi:excisionase family DNA binding protein
MTSTITPAAMTITEFREWSRMSRTRIYEELSRGTLRAIKVGRRTLITADAANTWLAAQPRYAHSGAVA